MPGIFISYRREDTSGEAGRLYDRLAGHFGKDQVFMDIDTIRPGVDFVEVINDAVGSCEVLVAVIGKQWLTVQDENGNRRLDDPEDFTRLEITAALDRNIRVIPALVGDAKMPKANLPEELVKFTRRQAIEISNLRFHDDVTRLIRVVEEVIGKQEEEEPQRREPAREKPEDAVPVPPEQHTPGYWQRPAVRTFWGALIGASYASISVGIGSFAKVGLGAPEVIVPEVVAGLLVMMAVCGGIAGVIIRSDGHGIVELILGIAIGVLISWAITYDLAGIVFLGVPLGAILGAVVGRFNLLPQVNKANLPNSYHPQVVSGIVGWVLFGLATYFLALWLRGGYRPGELLLGLPFGLPGGIAGAICGQYRRAMVCAAVGCLLVGSLALLITVALTVAWWSGATGAILGAILGRVWSTYKSQPVV